jgi:hypothetical protein
VLVVFVVVELLDVDVPSVFGVLGDVVVVMPSIVFFSCVNGMFKFFETCSAEMN